MYVVADIKKKIFETEKKLHLSNETPIFKSFLRGKICGLKEVLEELETNKSGLTSNECVVEW